MGCTIIVVGIWMLIDPHSILSQEYSNKAFDKFLDDSSQFGYQSIAAYLLIAVGVVVMVIGFIGCCGALRHSECLLCTVRWSSCHLLIRVSVVVLEFSLLFFDPSVFTRRLPTMGLHGQISSIASCL